MYLRDVKSTKTYCPIFKLKTTDGIG